MTCPASVCTITLQMSAYIYSCKYVIVDLGPGNNPITRNACMTSHGILLPLLVDAKGRSVIHSLSEHLETWVEEANAMRLETIAAPGNVTRYPMPQHMPKFLGVILSRMGSRGSVKPYNQWTALARIWHEMEHHLMPAVVASGLALDAPVYDNARAAVAQVCSHRSSFPPRA